MCLRTELKPNSLCILRSYARASSLGAVCRPSGQNPWSSVAIRKTGLPLRMVRGVPSTFSTETERMPK
ncbi:hypothetical protein SALBM135S_07306 [Streptomyces alboniger]